MGSIPDSAGLEHPEKIVDEILAELDNIQKKAQELAVFAGKAKELIESTKPTWQKLRDADGKEQSSKVYISGVSSLTALRDELLANHSKIDGLQPWAVSLISASGTTSSISATTDSVFFDATPFRPNPLVSEFEIEETQDYLLSRDPSLGKNFAAIEETLYGTTSDPIRAAMYLMRQVFDHFFALLVDEKISLDTDENQLATRLERIQFAANEHVSDDAQKHTLIENSRHFIDVYEVLNMAHKRGELNESKAKNALQEMYFLIHQWVVALKQ